MPGHTASAEKRRDGYESDKALINSLADSRGGTLLAH
jgi:hypothetical protein